MTKVLEDLLVMGLASARPAANAVVVGSRYFATDTEEESESNGTTWTLISTKKPSFVSAAKWGTD